MKRHILLIALGSLTACGRTDANNSQAQATEKFGKAFELREEALSGTIREPADSAEARAFEPPREEAAEGEATQETSNIYGGTIEEYRLAKQAKAAQELQSLNIRDPGQQTAAKLFVGETRASTARRLALDASSAWAGQSDLASRLVNAATAIRLRSHLANQYQNVNYDEQLAATQKAAEEQGEEVQQLTATVKGMNDRVAGLEEQVKTHTDTSRRKAEESEEFSRKAFTAKGQAQYDLYVKSGESKNEADAATAKADTAKLERDIEQAKLKVERGALEATEQHVQALQDAVEALRDRSAKTDKLAEAAAGDAQGLLEKEFDPLFQQMTRTQAERVAKPFDEALAAMTEAVSSAEEAAGSAPGDSRDAAQMHLFAARTELGQMQRRQVLVYTAYRDLLNTLQENLAEAQPDLAASIGEAITATDTRIAEVKGQAAEGLNKVLEELTPLADTAQSGGDPRQERLTLRHLIHTHRALAAITGEAKHTEHADKLVERLGQIKEGT